MMREAERAGHKHLILLGEAWEGDLESSHTMLLLFDSLRSAFILREQGTQWDYDKVGSAYALVEVGSSDTSTDLSEEDAIHWLLLYDMNILHPNIIKKVFKEENAGKLIAEWTERNNQRRAIA